MPRNRRDKKNKEDRKNKEEKWKQKKQKTENMGGKNITHINQKQIAAFFLGPAHRGGEHLPHNQLGETNTG